MEELRLPIKEFDTATSDSLVLATLTGAIAILGAFTAR